MVFRLLEYYYFYEVLLLAKDFFLTNFLVFKGRLKSKAGQLSHIPKDLSGDFKESETIKKLYRKLIDSFTVLQTELSGREKEIKRLKKGYDSEVFQKFLLGSIFLVTKYF